jgi:hypothetical protein
MHRFLGVFACSVVALSIGGCHSTPAPDASVSRNAATKDDAAEKKRAGNDGGRRDVLPALSDYEQQMIDYGFGAGWT